MNKQVRFYFTNKKNIVATTDYNFRTLEEAKQAASYMCAGAYVIGHKKVGVIGVIPAEMRESNHDQFIEYDFYSWDVLSEITPKACDFKATCFTERARFLQLHPELTPTSEEDKDLLALYEKKQIHKCAVMLFRHGKEYRAYFQDAYAILAHLPELCRQWHDHIEYVSFSISDFQDVFSQLNKVYSIGVQLDDCIIPE